jgi:hypothetical protein
MRFAICRSHNILGARYKGAVFSLLTDQPPTPTNHPWSFGIIDRQYRTLILGTWVGEPMAVQSVIVCKRRSAVFASTAYRTLSIVTLLIPILRRYISTAKMTMNPNRSIRPAKRGSQTKNAGVDNSVGH